MSKTEKILRSNNYFGRDLFLKLIGANLLAITTIFFSGYSSMNTSSDSLRNTIDNKIINSKKSISSSENLTNIIILFDGNEDPFTTFKEDCEVLFNDYRSLTNKKINVKFYSFPKLITVTSDVARKKLERKLKSWVDSKLTSFALEYGKIDKAIIALHSEKDKSYLSDLLLDVDSDSGSYNSNLIHEFVSANDVSYYASRNSLSDSIFEKDAQAIYFGCSAGDGDSSIASVFASSYSVSTEAPKTIYVGKIICDSNGVFKLSSKQNVVNKEIHAELFVDSLNNEYLAIENKNYLIDLTNDKITSVIDLFDEGLIKIRNPTEFHKIDSLGSIDDKLNYLGMKKLSEGVVDDYMETRIFNK
jgi:hypothetical protein